MLIFRGLRRIYPVALVFCLHCLIYPRSYAQPSLLYDDLSQGGVVPDSATVTCPALSKYYRRAAELSSSEGSLERWALLESELASLLSLCLRSGEYFALLGATQLNSFQNPRAIESLERSLLLQPTGGAARVDYAQALYNAGQLFVALELNEGLIAEGGLPSGLSEELQARGEKWLRDTRKNSFQVDIAGGFDTNLNGAPNARAINLTLSGEEVPLALGEAFRSTKGAYTTLRLGDQYRVLAAEHEHGFVAEARGRLSGDEKSDLMRFDSRYSFVKQQRKQDWRIDGGLTHLLFGGSDLFSSAQISGRYQYNRAGACSPVIELAGQQQYFKQQKTLDAFEGKLSGGLQCDLEIGPNGRYSTLGVDFGVLRNYAVNSSRPGGDRTGWQVSAQLRVGELWFQASQTTLNDARGYSPILISGAARWVKQNQFVMQYRRPVQFGARSATLQVNFFHQNQESNISLFSSRDTALELGFGFVF